MSRLRLVGNSDDATQETSVPSIQRSADGTVVVHTTIVQQSPDELRPLPYWLEAFDLPESTVRGWIRSGALPAIQAKRGGTLVRRSDLLAVVDKLSESTKATISDTPATYAGLVERSRRSQ